MGDGPVIYDRRSESKLVVEPAGAYDSNPGGEIRWQPDGDWLFALDEGLVAGGAPYCRHISILRADGTGRRDLSFVGEIDTSTAANWLPSQVKLEYLPQPLQNPLYPAPDQILQGDRW